MTRAQQSRALARRLGFLVGIDWIEEIMRRRLREFGGCRVFDNNGGGTPSPSFKVVI